MFSSQTIGVEFSSKIVKVGTGNRRKRIKLQLWDTAGTERFRSVSRSYYRGAAGAILVYDIGSLASFNALPTFLMDARALASPQLTVLLAGNKNDLTDLVPKTPQSFASTAIDEHRPLTGKSSLSSLHSSFPADGSGGTTRSTSNLGLTAGGKQTATISNDGPEVSPDYASRWASKSNIPVCVDVSALSGENVDELFNRLARMILTKIELGEIDPDDPQSGIQYGDAWASTDTGSIKSGMSIDDGGLRHRRGRRRAGTGGFMSGLNEWQDVFRVSGTPSRRGRCC